MNASKTIKTGQSREDEYGPVGGNDEYIVAGWGKTYAVYNRSKPHIWNLCQVIQENLDNFLKPGRDGEGTKTLQTGLVKEWWVQGIKFVNLVRTQLFFLSKHLQHRREEKDVQWRQSFLPCPFRGYNRMHSWSNISIWAKHKFQLYFLRMFDVSKHFKVRTLISPCRVTAGGQS